MVLATPVKSWQCTIRILVFFVGIVLHQKASVVIADEVVPWYRISPTTVGFLVATTAEETLDSTAANIPGLEALQLLVVYPTGHRETILLPPVANPTLDIFSDLSVWQTIESQPDSSTFPNGLYTWEIRSMAERRYRTEDEANSLDPTKTSANTIYLSGTFRVDEGAILDPDVTEESINNESGGMRRHLMEEQTEKHASASSASITALSDKRRLDQVIVDDLIVDGSICVGTDCVNDENFGFDTVRVKENNLRMHFDDTSSTGSFPKNDWSIIANDSGNGGSEYFAIEDRTAGKQVFKVNAGAAADTLVVDENSRIGIGTGIPETSIHAIRGDTPAIRLEQDGSSGFTPQTVRFLHIVVLIFMFPIHYC